MLIPAGKPACREPQVRSLHDTRVLERSFLATWVMLRLCNLVFVGNEVDV